MVFGGETSGRLGGVTFILLGLVLLGFGARSALGIRDFVRHAARADGEVIGLNAGGSHPQIQFVTPDSRVVSFPQGGLIFGYRQGDRVQVLFDPAEPAATATIATPGSLWFPALVLGGIGLVFIAVGTITWRWTAGSRQP